MQPTARPLPPLPKPIAHGDKLTRALDDGVIAFTVSNGRAAIRHEDLGRLN